MARVLIAGGPKTGKTTLSISMGEESGVAVRHTDDLIGKADWSGASEEVARWFDAAGDWIIEGVAVPRALRKWLAAHPEGKPADKLIWLYTARQPLSAGQTTMAKGCSTVMREIARDLLGRGVVIVQQ